MTNPVKNNPCLWCKEIEEKRTVLNNIKPTSMQDLMVPGLSFSKAMNRALYEQEIFHLKNHACYRKTQWYE